METASEPTTRLGNGSIRSQAENFKDEKTSSSPSRPLPAWDGVSLSIFGKKLKEGRRYEEAISCLSDDAGWLCLV